MPEQSHQLPHSPRGTHPYSKDSICLLQQGLPFLATARTALDPEGDTVAGTIACHLPGSLLGAPAAKSWRSCE